MIQLNKYKNHLTILLLLILFVGCEDVIQVNLNSTDPQIVLEANINDELNISTLKITQSTDFYNPGQYEGIEGAVVTISDENGNSEMMHGFSDGSYQTDLIIGRPNTKYFLKVEVDGKTYLAESSMPNRTQIDSLSVEEAKNRPGGEDGNVRYILHVYFVDEANIDNYYRFKIYAHGVVMPGFIIFNDKYSDGNEIDGRLIIDSETFPVSKGDVVTVELQSISEDVYYFYKTANGVNASGTTNGGQPQSTSVAPTNPESNWDNNALGYFSAYSSSKKDIVLSD